MQIVNCMTCICHQKQRFYYTQILLSFLAIWGVAIDGIPIYGPFDEDGRQLTKEDLDECGGKVDSTGRYKYHMTVDPPYSLGCLRGEVSLDKILFSNETVT